MIRLAEVFDELRAAFLEGQELAFEKDAGFGCGRLQVLTKTPEHCGDFRTLHRCGRIEPGSTFALHDPGLQGPGHSLPRIGRDLVLILESG